MVRETKMAHFSLNTAEAVDNVISSQEILPAICQGLNTAEAVDNVITKKQIKMKKFLSQYRRSGR